MNMKKISPLYIRYSITGPDLRLCILVTIIFVLLKVTHCIDWSWLWIIAPIWLPWSCVFLLWFICSLWWYICNITPKIHKPDKRIKQ